MIREYLCQEGDDINSIDNRFIYSKAINQKYGGVWFFGDRDGSSGAASAIERRRYVEL